MQVRRTTARRRLLVAALGLAAVAAAVVVVVLVVTRGDGADEPALRWSRPAIEQALERRLAAVPLTVRWVQCGPPRSGTTTYRGAVVLRCAANFGPPHLPVYCATIVDGRLVTDRDVPSMRCGRAAPRPRSMR
jgi:hypothetical protein